MATTTTNKVLDGTDLILSMAGKALGFSDSCKISTTAEVGERLTKESASGKWKEKYVKSYSEEISASGCVLRTPDSNKPTYMELRAAMLDGEPIQASYAVRASGDAAREGDATNNCSGNYLITSLELDGPAGEDAKYTVKLENVGAITTSGAGVAVAAS